MILSLYIYIWTHMYMYVYREKPCVVHAYMHVHIYMDGYGYMSVCTCLCLRLIFDIVTSSFTYWGKVFAESGDTLSSSIVSLMAPTVPNSSILQKWSYRRATPNIAFYLCLSLSYRNASPTEKSNQSVLGKIHLKKNMTWESKISVLKEKWFVSHSQENMKM